LRADPIGIEVVSHLGEATSMRETGGAAFTCDGRERDGAPALATQQVMPVLGRARQSIKQLAVFGPLGLGDPVVGQAPQNPVDTGQDDPHGCVVPFARRSWALRSLSNSPEAAQEISVRGTDETDQ
jgi:hypothetical protein